MPSFGERLAHALSAHGPLCVGIDPHEHLLEEAGEDASAAGARAFGLRVVEAAADRVGVVKPQVAFFERYGAAGFAALEDVLRAAREAGLLVVADAKRGDIGSTMTGYAMAWLSPGAPLEVDAVTLSPYLGPASLSETLALAGSSEKGAFVLAATSNPEAGVVQRARTEGERSVAAVVYDTVASANAAFAGDALGSFGVVVGATLAPDERGLPNLDPRTPVLAPGFGAQGAEPADLPRLFGAAAGAVLANESRSLLAGDPAGLAARIGGRAERYREAVAGGAR